MKISKKYTFADFFSKNYALISNHFDNIIFYYFIFTIVLFIIYYLLFFLERERQRKILKVF